MGISTKGRSIATALRIRVSMSAIGSVIIGSPARLLHSRNQSVQGHVAEAQPAQLEFAVHGARPAAQLAPPLAPATELRFAVCFLDLCLAGHNLSLRIVSWSRSRVGSAPRRSGLNPVSIHSPAARPAL